MSKAHPVENDVKAEIRKLLTLHGWKHWPVAASRFGVGGLSDRMAIRGEPGAGCIYMAIEAKKGKVTKTTALQSSFLQDVREQGGIGIVVNAELLPKFRLLLERISAAYPRNGEAHP